MESNTWSYSKLRIETWGTLTEMGQSLAMPIIIKYRDEKTELSLELEASSR
ncbi:MAG TPA: hypothetical protein VMU62_07865 [Acidobacteriaceae bacterium]|nr:hypothetical protein [Acidobacteriaceae bacterium]